MRAEELKAKHEKKARSGLLFLLLMAFVCAMGGFGYAWYHVESGLENAAWFGMELDAPALFYAKYVHLGFVFPVVVWVAALAVTKLGNTQRSIGTMLAILLFAYAILWPAGAFVAFMDAYDPPRTTHTPSGQPIPE